MARKRWVMTAARKAYYQSKKKGTAKRGATRRLSEYGKAFKGELAYERKLFKQYKGQRGMQRVLTMNAHRGTGNVVRTPEGVAKFRKVQKLMNKAYRRKGIMKTGSWGRRYEKI